MKEITDFIKEPLSQEAKAMMEEILSIGKMLITEN